MVETRCGRTETEGSLFTVVVSEGGQRGEDGGLCCLLLFYASDFQLCSSHGTHKLITTKSLWHTKNMFFADLTKNRYTLDSFKLLAIVVLAVVLFLFDNLREKRLVPLTK